MPNPSHPCIPVASLSRRVFLLVFTFALSGLFAATVHAQSIFPPACTTLQASATPSVPSDTARLQAALDRCRPGEAVELTPGESSGAQTFVIAPIRLPAGVTLLIDAGVTVAASLNPSDFRRTGFATEKQPCGPAGCKPLITVVPSSGTPGGLMGFGTLDGRGSAPLDGLQAPWSSFPAEDRPTLIEASGAFALRALLLRNAPADALRFAGQANLEVDGITLVSPANVPGTRGIVLADNSESVSVLRSTLSVTGADLVGIRGTRTLLKHISLYAGTGAEPASSGHNHCVLNSEPVPQCLPAALPAYTGHLFLSSPEGTNLSSATAGGSLILTAVVRTPEASTAAPAGPIQFFAGDLLLGSAEIADSHASLTLPAMTPGIHAITARFAGEIFGPVTVIQPAQTTTSATIAALEKPRAASTQPKETPAAASSLLDPGPFTLVAAPSTVFTGASITLTAQGLPPDATGTVTFLDQGTPVGSATITRGVLAPAYQAFGDDNALGLTASSPALTYAGRLATDFGLTLSNQAAWGSGTCDILAQQILPNNLGPSAHGSPLTSVSSGLNEIYNFDWEASFRTCHQAALAWLAIPREYKVLAGDAGAVATSGAWQTPDPAVFDSTYRTLYNTSGSGTAEFTLSSTGGPLYLWYLLNGNDFGTFTVSIDGVPDPTPHTSQPVLGTDTASGVGFALLRLSVAAGAHVVDVTLTSGTLGVLGVGTPPPTNGAHPTVLAGDVFNENQAAPRDPAATSAGYTVDVQNNVALLAGDGLDVRLVATRQLMLGAPAEMTDEIHPDDLGFAHLETAFFNALTGTNMSPYRVYAANFPSVTTTLANEGGRRLTALYSGDSVYAAATSSPAPVAVHQGYTTLALAASSLNVAYNTPVTLTASVTPADALGTVTFLESHTTPIGTAPVINGVATLTLTFPIGGHYLTATFAPSDTRQPSGSQSVSVQVARRVGQMAVVAQAAGLASSQSGVITATFTPSTQTGKVTFTDSIAGVIDTVPIINGVAVIGTPTLSAGIHTITSSYTGDAVFAPLTGMPVSLSIQRIAPSLLAWPLTTNPVVGSAVSVHVDVMAAATPVLPTAPSLFPKALNQTTVFMGDSITQWWSLPINDAGIAGQTSSDMLARFAHDVLGHGYERVILLAGTNDIIHFAADAPTTLANIQTMAAMANAAGMRPILCTILPITLNGVDMNAQVAQVNAGIFALAAQYGYLVVDYHAAMVQHTNYQEDGVHPDPGGYALMETALAQTLIPPSGSVVLPDGTSATLSATGTADISITPLASGAEVLAVSFPGDSDFLPASAAVSFNVAPAASATTLQASPLAGYSGNAVAFTARVSGSVTGALAGTLAGLVNFLDGANVLGTATLRKDGTAVWTASGLPAGGHTFTAAYAGSANFAASTSQPVALSSPFLNTSLTLAAPATSFFAGAPVTLTATLTPGTAPGSIVLADAGTGSSAPAILAQVPLVAGPAASVASFTSTTLSPGMHQFTAVYAGDANNSNAQSPVLSLTVKPNATTLTLGPLPASVVYGTAVDLAGSLTPVGATGSLTFQDRFTAAGQSAVQTQTGTGALLNGSAHLALPLLDVGVHVLSASYAGDTADLPASSASFTVTVTPVVTAVVLTTSTPTVALNAPAMLSASVTPASASGTLTLADGSGPLGQANIVNGMATWSLAELSLGVHTLTVSYAGDATDSAATSNAVNVTVTLNPATVTLAALPSSVQAGTSLTLAATVTPAAATGIVTFRDAATGTVGQAGINAGVATLTLPGLALGAHTFTAVYGGDGADTGATSNAVSTTVALAPSSVSLQLSSATAAYGAAVTVTATVLPASATGMVTLSDGAGLLATGALVHGAASFSLPLLAVGTHELVAAYGGDGRVAASRSDATALTITQDTSATTLSVAQASVPFGSAAVVNVQVASLLGTIPTGTVTLRSGAVVLATGVLGHGAGTTAYATLSADTTQLGPGSFPVIAIYGGDADNTLSSSGAGTLTIARVGTTATLTLPLSAVPIQAPVRVQATVAGSLAGLIPAGAVAFSSNGAVFATVALDATGTATATLATPALGQYAIAATYVPTGVFAGSATGARTLTVTPPLSAAMEDSTLNLTGHGAGSVMLVLTPLSGYQGTAAAQCATAVTYLECTVDAPAALTGTAPVRTAVHVSVLYTSGMARPALMGSRRAVGYAGLLVLLLPLARARRRLASLLVLLVVLAGGLTGCALGGNFGAIPSGAQVATVTVTANGLAVRTQLTVNLAE